MVVFILNFKIFFRTFDTISLPYLNQGWLIEAYRSPVQLAGVQVDWSPVLVHLWYKTVEQSSVQAYIFIYTDSNPIKIRPI